MPRQPDYQRIADDLRRRIDSGEFEAGAKLPSQSDLAIHYRVSLQPVKTALRDLEREGLLEGHQGKGVFVAGTPAEEK